jgi:hypothetical protein
MWSFMQPAIRPSPGVTPAQSFLVSETHALAAPCAMAFDASSNKEALTAKTIFNIALSYDPEAKFVDLRR